MVQINSIIVCIKQVPEITQIKIDRRSGKIRKDIPHTMHSEDKAALEVAYQLSTKTKATIKVISVSTEDAIPILREAYAMGAHEAYLLNDPLFDTTDGIGTAYILSKAIKKIGSYDLIITGSKSLDNYAGEVPSALSAFLEISNVTNVISVSIETEILTITRIVDRVIEKRAVKLPAIISVRKNAVKPRLISPLLIKKAMAKTPTIFSAKDLEITVDELHQHGSFLKVKELFFPEPRTGCEFLKEGSVEERVKELTRILQNKKVLGW